MTAGALVGKVETDDEMELAEKFIAIHKILQHLLTIFARLVIIHKLK